MAKVKYIPLLFLFFTVSLFSTLSSAQLSEKQLFGNDFKQQEFLPVDQAFVFDFIQTESHVEVFFTISPGYYLYKNQFNITATSASLGNATYSESELIHDEFFGETPVFFTSATISYPIVSAAIENSITLTFQGCAEAGFCYPPATHTFSLAASEEIEQPVEETTENTVTDENQSVQYSISSNLATSDNLVITLLGFIVLGIGLAFTPCVFPMYPIISSIVLGHNANAKKSSAQSLKLSFVYVQGMALTYSLLGLVVASVGVKFQAFLQHPLILVSMIVLFVVFALSLFGLFEIQLPARWQEKLNAMSNQQSQGKSVGVFIMGVISGLVASPCTTAPLTGILLFISQSGDLLLGFSSLYALSIGMGIPLIVFAVTGGKLLPNAGSWMLVVKTTFGFFMLAVAIFFVERLVEELVVNTLWFALGVAACLYYMFMNSKTSSSTAKGMRYAVLSLLLALAAYTFYITLAENSENTSTTHTTITHPEFIEIVDLKDFEQKLAIATAENKFVMVDLYADWCVACKEFEKYTFTAPEVIESLTDSVWMQIDLTDINIATVEFQEHYDILGLPTILFFDKNGKEIQKARVTGFMNAKSFAEHVKNHLK